MTRCDLIRGAVFCIAAVAALVWIVDHLVIT